MDHANNLHALTFKDPNVGTSLLSQPSHDHTVASEVTPVSQRDASSDWPNGLSAYIQKPKYESVSLCYH